MQEGTLPPNHWNLGYCSAVTPNNNDAYDDDNDHSSMAIEGSTITIDSPSSVITNLNLASNTTNFASVSPSSPEWYVMSIRC
jgi:hypothetical protein